MVQDALAERVETRAGRAGSEFRAGRIRRELDGRGMAHRTFPRRILHAITRAHRVKQLLELLRRIALQLLLDQRLIDALEDRPRPLAEEVLRVHGVHAKAR